MLEVIIAIILLPVAICAGAFTIALGAGTVKYFKDRKAKRKADSV